MIEVAEHPMTTGLRVSSLGSSPPTATLLLCGLWWGLALSEPQFSWLGQEDEDICLTIVSLELKQITWVCGSYTASTQ